MDADFASQLMKDIELIKIEDLNGFNKNEFCLSPNYYKLKYHGYGDSFKNFIREIAKKAENINSICVALNNGSAIGEGVSYSMCGRFLLFNARAAKNEDESSQIIRAVILNNPQNRCLSEFFITYSKGEIY